MRLARRQFGSSGHVFNWGGTYKVAGAGGPWATLRVHLSDSNVVPVRQNGAFKTVQSPRAADARYGWQHSAIAMAIGSFGGGFRSFAEDGMARKDGIGLGCAMPSLGPIAAPQQWFGMAGAGRRGWVQVGWFRHESDEARRGADLGGEGVAYRHATEVEDWRRAEIWRGMKGTD
jgi:hypothetical protein